MKILVEFDLEIEGECSEDFAREQFREWFGPVTWKVSPDDNDDDFQVWIKGWAIKEERHMTEEGILIPDHYTLTITPAIQPEKRHKIEECLKQMEFTVWGGGTDTDLTSCDITFE